MTDYLPRINTVLNDLGLKVAPPPAGPKVTLLGVTSNPNVPLLEPFTIGSVEKAINTLYFNFSGVASYPSTNVPGELALAIEEAVNAGAPNIEVIAIACASGQALLNYIQPQVVHTGRYADLSGAYDVLRNRELDVVVPVGAYIDDSWMPSNQNFGKQLANFCFQATTESNSCHGVIAVRPPLTWAMSYRSGAPAGSFATGLSATTNFSGELSSLFTASYGVLSAAALQSGLASVYFGTPSSALFNEWVAYHAYPCTAGRTTSAINGAANYNPLYLAWLSGAADQNSRTLSDTSDSLATSVDPSYFANWQAYDSDGNPKTDSRGVKVDAGAYISVIAAPLRSPGTQTKSAALTYGASIASTSRNIDGAAAYAGLINSLAPQSSTTNKSIPGVVGLKMLSARQANDLTGMRIVTLYSRTRGLVVAKGMTGAYNVSSYVRSDYVNLTTVRIVFATVDLIRAVADKYIGEPNNAPQMNALDAEIDQTLLTLKGQGALNAYQFSISSTPDQRVLGQLDINLTLVPAFEIQKINLTVSLSKEL